MAKEPDSGRVDCSLNAGCSVLANDIRDGSSFQTPTNQPVDVSGVPVGGEVRVGLPPCLISKEGGAPFQKSMDLQVAHTYHKAVNKGECPAVGGRKGCWTEKAEDVSCRLDISMHHGS